MEVPSGIRVKNVIPGCTCNPGMRKTGLHSPITGFYCMTCGASSGDKHKEAIAQLNKIREAVERCQTDMENVAREGEAQRQLYYDLCGILEMPF